MNKSPLTPPKSRFQDSSILRNNPTTYRQLEIRCVMRRGTERPVSEAAPSANRGLTGRKDKSIRPIKKRMSNSVIPLVGVCSVLYWNLIGWSMLCLILLFFSSSSRSVRGSVTCLWGTTQGYVSRYRPRLSHSIPSGLPYASYSQRLPICLSHQESYF